MGAAEKLDEFMHYNVIDKDKLQSIVDLGDGDDSFLKELTDIFFDRAPMLVSEIQTALQKKTLTSWKDRLMH